MKKNILVLTLCLIFLAFTQVHAAIYGEGEYQQFYYHLGNPMNGTFVQSAYPASDYYFDEDISQEVSKDEGNPAAFADGISRFHKPLLGSPDFVNDNLIKFQAGAKGPDGGVNPENSVQVKGYGEILLHNDFDCQNHGVDFDQNVHTHINRKFSVDDGTYSVNAWMAGTGVFTEIPDDYNGNHFAEYGIEGRARLNGFINGDTLIPLGILLSFNFNEAGTESEEIELSAQSQDGDPIYYVLSVGLDLDAILRNAWNDELTSPNGATNFVSSSLGTKDSPFEVGATLTETPVPIPGSLFLLLSGLGGMSVLGRRFKKS